MRTLPLPHRLWYAGLLPRVLLACGLFALLWTAWGASIGPSQPLSSTAHAAAPLPIAAWDGACGSENPYFVTDLYSRGTDPKQAALVAFHDTPDNSGHTSVATQGEVGSTYGLGYDGRHHLLYAAAYHKRGAPFGPAGPGGIYRIDVASGKVEPWITVPNAGVSQHDKANDYFPDTKARDLVGVTSLGDLDLAEDYETLYVTNLLDRKIYRYRVSDKKLLGTIAIGAAKEKWFPDSRPFGLALRYGKLYHAVVNSAYKSEAQDDLWAYVYESNLDGGDMRQVAAFSLDYARSNNRGGRGGGGFGQRWQVWRDGVNPGQRGGVGPGFASDPQPMITDIEFGDGGEMILGIRDRSGDMGYFFGNRNDLPNVPINEPATIPEGDIVRGTLSSDQGRGVSSGPGQGATWDFEPSPEYFAEDAGPGLRAGRPGTPGVVHPETSFGGLARLFAVNAVVMTSNSPLQISSGGAVWFNIDTAVNTRREELYKLDFELNFGKANGLGDLELLCAPELIPTPTPTNTAVPTETPRPTSTPTDVPTATPVPTITPTPTPGIYRIYLPFASHEKVCIPDAYHTDVVLVLDRSTSMLRPIEEGGIPKNEAAIEAAKSFVALLDYVPDILNRHDQVAIVGFNDLAWIENDLTNNPDEAIASLERIRTKTQEGTRLDLAFERGQEPLSGPKHKKENRPVMIVLTDGIPNRVPFPPGGKQEDTVLAKAYAARELGTRVYTIGLGKPRDLFPKLMIQAASERSFYYYAPRPEDLAGIYAQIAATFNDCNPHPVPKVTPCVSEDSYIDVVLVLDMSTSMYRETRNGRSKQAAAIEAAHLFVGDLDLEPDGWGRQDQVAVVGFNDSAWIQMRLTDDKVAVDHAIDQLSLKAAEGTRLDLGFIRGQEALDTDKRNPENRPVMVFLTDGLPNRVPFPPGGRQEDTVLEAAKRVKDAGTRLFTIGLGAPEDIEGWLLESCATDKSMYYYAPDGEDLAAIYHQIAGRVVECPR